MLCKRWVGHGITVNLANLWTKGFDCGAWVSLQGVFVFLSSATFQVEVSSHGSPKVGLMGEMGAGESTGRFARCLLCCCAIGR